MANLAEQAHAPDGSPGQCLARLAELSELLVDSDSITPPLFIARLTGFSEADEMLARQAYLEATCADGVARTGRGLRWRPVGARSWPNHASGWPFSLAVGATAAQLGLGPHKPAAGSRRSELLGIGGWPSTSGWR